MSANDDRGQEDTVDLKDLEKMISKFAESVEKLTEKLGKNSKAFDANRDLVAEHSEQTKKNKLEVQQAYFDNLKEMAKWRKANKEGVSQFQMFTGILRNGVSALGVMRAVTDHLGSLGDKFDEHSRSVSELAELNEKLGEVKAEKQEESDMATPPEQKGSLVERLINA